MYKENEVLVKMRTRITENFKTIKVIHQGGSTSPTLSMVYLDSSVKTYNRKSEEMGYRYKKYLYLLSFVEL